MSSIRDFIVQPREGRIGEPVGVFFRSHEGCVLAPLPLSAQSLRCSALLQLMTLGADIEPRKAGGRTSRQPGQIRKEAAVTSFAAGRFSLPPSFFSSFMGHFSTNARRAFRCAPGPRIMADMSDLLSDDKAANTPAPYQVLARKYRPQRFEDLIGHEAMVKTLQNAFAADRIAHAYILTGVRGVGKTTTARILARALNYMSAPMTSDNGPQMAMAEEGRHCKAIAESRHPDVLEMDAASRTGVGDIRELIEGVRYAPIEARYKVYIIDEVHMLSTAAFNALLKTLEEPPPHVKFIFATTEIRKVPVTVSCRVVSALT